MIPWTNDLDIAVWKPDLLRLKELDPDFEAETGLRYFLNHDTGQKIAPLGQVCTPNAPGYEPGELPHWRADAPGQVERVTLTDHSAECIAD